MKSVPSSQARPTFLFGFHRGGSTFVQRLLNCHRGVTIWGENAGLISHLRLLHDSFVSSPIVSVDPVAYRAFSEFAPEFIPWVNPFSKEGFARHLARLVEGMYRTGAGDERVWGFKEIRHCEVDDVAFLLRLFPTCRILQLTRDPKAVVLSRFCVRWSRAQSGISAEEFVRGALQEYFQRLDAFLLSAATWPSAVHLLKYEEIRGDVVVPAVFGTLGIPSEGVDDRLLSMVLNTVRGSSYLERGRDVSEEERSRVACIFDEVVDDVFSAMSFRSERAAVSGWYSR